MAFNDDHTLVELQQIDISREYQDQWEAGPQNEFIDVSGFPDVADFNDNFNRTLSAIRRIIHGALPSGNGNWYDAPSIGVSGLHQLVIELQGVSGVSQQDWTSVYNVGSGILDMSLFDADVRIPDGGTWFFNDGTGANAIMEITNSGILIREVGFREILTFTTPFAAGATITVPNSRVYTEGDQVADQYRNLRMFYNGQLMSPGSGAVAGDEKRRDYQESSPTAIITNRQLQGSANRPGRLEFHING